MAYERIVASAAYAVAKAEPAAIDRRGLHRSNIALLRRCCVRALDPTPEYALTDGFPVLHACPHSRSRRAMPAVSVAAASIVAKVTRDRIMRRMHRRYPDFGFDHNVGYGTPEHLDVLDRRSHADPPALVRVRRAVASLGARPVRRGHDLGDRVRDDGAMNEDDIERFEEERELELYREYRDVLPMFAFVIETERRFYLANKVDIQHLDGGGSGSSSRTHGSGTCSGRRASSPRFGWSRATT